MRHRLGLIIAIILLAAATGHATIFGTVRGIVHDLQHRPIDGAQVTLRAKYSDWQKQEKTNADGEFHFDAVAAGEYTIQVQREGFRETLKDLTVSSGSAPVLHLPMHVSTVEEKVEVSATVDASNPQASASQISVDRREIEENPGASRPNSLALVTNLVPGAYMVHNQLHIRGGHQVSWLVDGVPVPNTNIASNVGAQFDPKDMDFVEISRGGYSAEYGDRTYGVINVIPRSGFERNQEAEIVASFGSFYETNDQFNLGSHTDRFAYYASANGYRTDLGLQTPVNTVIHDRASGEGGFASLIWNTTASDQLRLATAIRGDHYQIPNGPDDQAAGTRDVEQELDAFTNFSWVRTFSPGLLLTFSPFYHYNRAALDGGTTRSSQYAGGQMSLALVQGHHNARVGLYGFAQHDNSLFRVKASDSGLTITQMEKPSGNLEAFFLEDQWSLTNWITVSGGIRLTHFSSALRENAASPRAGTAIRIPKLRWILRAYYGRYYQAPPLDTISGRLLRLLVDPQTGILPLRGERDEQREVGLTIPVRNWIFDFSNFRTNARNFFDHSVIGNSNIFFPLTIASARIRGWEATARSPRLWRRAQIRLVYSNQSAQGRGIVTGGLTDFSSPDSNEFFYLDHDQRNTVAVSGEVSLPWRSWASANISYGSGFLDGNGPRHKPQHTTADFALGKCFGERWSLTFTALNIANRRYLLDDSNTFGGTHFTFPRQLSGELRYRFHY